MPSSIIHRRNASNPCELEGVCADGRFPLKIRSAWSSVAGGREYNEDRCFCCDENQMYMVVDGMGGHRGGALASQIAVETVPVQWGRHAIQTRISHIGLQSSFCSAVCRASSEMSAIARQYPEYERMGCTLAVAWIIGDRLYFSNVGDCRVYLLHQDNLRRLTKDETLVQALVDGGVISKKDARTHRWRHVVINSVNAQGLQQKPRLQLAEFHPGDRVLVTSDGLPDELTDAEIEEIMSRALDPDQCVEQLIAAALDREARDNVSCVVIEL